MRRFAARKPCSPAKPSIIDVETLRGLGETEGTDSLELVTKDGRRVTAGRSEIAALTAELAITMRHKPDDFFEHTDLLDFPGYRSRLKTDGVAANSPSPIKSASSSCAARWPTSSSATRQISN